MPIEIKELVVRIVVQDTARQPVSASRPLTEVPVKKIIEECVERVLEKLEAKAER